MVAARRTAVAVFQRLDQLPGGDNRAIGAGYAMAVAAIVVAALYMAVAAVGILLIVLNVVSAGGDPPVAFLVAGPVGLASGVASLSALVAPLLFCTGVVAWRFVPPTQRYSGVIAGVVAMGLAYAVAGVGVSGPTLVAAAVSDQQLGRSLISALGVVVVAFAATAWIAFPVAGLAGRLYERSEPAVAVGDHTAE
jgi:hypothetical protein